MAIFPTLTASFGCAFRIIFEVASAILAAFTTRRGCAFTIFSKITGTTTMLRHIVSPQFIHAK